MKRNLICLALALCAFTSARADELIIPPVDYPTLPATGASADAFVPTGWRLEFDTRGDLDRDGREDLVLVLRMNDPANIVKNEGLGAQAFDTNPRMLMVAFAGAGGYRRVLEDHALIPRPDNPVMDDYLDGGDAVVVRRGALTVRLHLWASAGSWFTGNTSLTFRHQDGCFRLIGHDSFGLHRASLEATTTSINYLSGKVEFLRENYQEDAPPERKAGRVPKRELPCLETIGDGIGFETGVHSPFDG